jgi:hypothetical protein
MNRTGGQSFGSVRRIAQVRRTILAAVVGE